MKQFILDKNKYFFTCTFLVFFFAFILYLPLLKAEYLWDDTLIFVTNGNLVGDKLTWEILSEPILPGTTYLRPLVTLSWFVEFHIFGQNTVISHSINLIIFFLNSLLVGIIATKLAKLNAYHRANWIGLFASALYLFHPATLETTAWVSGRFDQMVTLFCLLAISLFLSKKSTFKVFLIGVCYLLALFSKELGIILPVLLLLFSIIKPLNPESSFVKSIKASIVSNKLLWLLLVVITGFYFIIRIYSMDSLYHSKFTSYYVNEIIINQLKPFQTLKYYILETVYPFRILNPIHPINSLDLTSLVSKVSSIIIFFIVAFLSVVGLLKRNVVGILFVCSLLSISLVLHFIPLSIMDNLFHERFMTLQLAFSCMMFSLIPYSKIFNKLNLKQNLKKYLSIIAICSWFFYCIVTLYSVIPFWMNELSLWYWTYQSYPDNEVMRYNYLLSASQYDRDDILTEEFEKIKKSDEGFSPGTQILYANYLLKDKDPESLNYLEGLIQVLPKFHNMADGKLKMNSFQLSARMISGIYSDYSGAMLIFKDNPQEALKQNQIAEFYLREGEKYPLLQYRVATLLILNRQEEAKEISDELKLQNFPKGDKYKQQSINVVNLYCSKDNFEIEVCKNNKYLDYFK
ncbi:hypothetical protein [Psychrobacter sp. I-STPA10]|uniref:hypothetical protein n=1 Tax=Psychrobacter sp. I-STPA10 TaxID=2585769 RepID=UPI001E523D0B|nr:hypothetical protein [Psychrobacter sp. I-STPA10]